MRPASRVLAALALALMFVGLTSGTVYHWTIGLTLALAAAGCAIRADNTDIRYGRVS